MSSVPRKEMSLVCLIVFLDMVGFSIIFPLFPDMLVFNALSAGLVMGIMIIPMVSSLSETSSARFDFSMKELYSIDVLKLINRKGTFIKLASEVRLIVPNRILPE